MDNLLLFTERLFGTVDNATDGPTKRAHVDLAVDVPTALQVSTLEAEFDDDPYCTPARRDQLATKTSLPPKYVQVLYFATIITLLSFYTPLHMEEERYTLDRCC